MSWGRCANAVAPGGGAEGSVGTDELGPDGGMVEIGPELGGGHASSRARAFACTARARRCSVTRASRSASKRARSRAVSRVRRDAPTASIAAAPARAPRHHDRTVTGNEMATTTDPTDTTAAPIVSFRARDHRARLPSMVLGMTQPPSLPTTATNVPTCRTSDHHQNLLK